MDARERQIIDELFRKLAEVSQRTGLREPEAEALIERRMSELPGAAYYMLQTLMIQEQALLAAQDRIRDMEDRTQRSARPGGFLSGILGPSGDPARARPTGGAWGPTGGRPSTYSTPAGGNGFLAGAAQTAMGVAGGVVLGSFIADMLTPDGSDLAAMDGFTDPDDPSFGGDSGSAQDFGDDFGGGDFGGDA